ncbi:uncharacterized protein LOC127010904 [Drosophila biarmipes]|uniref:uncharacterized protein LOC127010904 n=1 Tax=Drosophila biarmipes TaxID=125945 RepID=UPI0021CCDAFF|nr:uncharacterized protein LOC127010904 [Drosophila biarmipes]
MSKSSRYTKTLDLSFAGITRSVSRTKRYAALHRPNGIFQNWYNGLPETVNADKLEVYAGDVVRLIYPVEDPFNAGQRTEPVFSRLGHHCCTIGPCAFALLDDTQLQHLIDFLFDHLLLRRRHRIQPIFEDPSSFHQLNGVPLHAGDSEDIPFKSKELLFDLISCQLFLRRKAPGFRFLLVLIFLISVVLHLTGMDFFSFLDATGFPTTVGASPNACQKSTSKYELCSKQSDNGSVLARSRPDYGKERVDRKAQRFHQLSTTVGQHTYTVPRVQQASELLAEVLHLGEGSRIG